MLSNVNIVYARAGGNLVIARSGGDVDHAGIGCGTDIHGVVGIPASDRIQTTQNSSATSTHSQVVNILPVQKQIDGRVVGAKSAPLLPVMVSLPAPKAITMVPLLVMLLPAKLTTLASAQFVASRPAKTAVPLAEIRNTSVVA